VQSVHEYVIVAEVISPQFLILTDRTTTSNAVLNRTF